jgi:hypothetical protein
MRSVNAKLRKNVTQILFCIMLHVLFMFLCVVVSKESYPCIVRYYDIVSKRLLVEWTGYDGADKFW